MVDWLGRLTYAIASSLVVVSVVVHLFGLLLVSVLLGNS